MDIVDKIGLMAALQNVARDLHGAKGRINVIESVILKGGAIPHEQLNKKFEVLQQELRNLTLGFIDLVTDIDKDVIVEKEKVS